MRPLQQSRGQVELLPFPNPAFEAARLAEEKRKAEETARLADEQRKTEEAGRLADEQRKTEEAARLAEEQRKADEAGWAKERRKAEPRSGAAGHRAVQSDPRPQAVMSAPVQNAGGGVFPVRICSRNPSHDLSEA